MTNLRPIADVLAEYVGGRTTEPDQDRARSVGDRGFGFHDLDRLTPDLDGPARCQVFGKLPARLQREAWDDLAERLAEEQRDLFADEDCWCSEPASPC